MFPAHLSIRLLFGDLCCSGSVKRERGEKRERDREIDRERASKHFPDFAVSPDKIASSNFTSELDSNWVLYTSSLVNNNLLLSLAVKCSLVRDREKVWGREKERKCE